MRQLTNSDWRPIAFALAGILVLAALAAGPRAKAETHLLQTVPTPTPRVVPAPQAPRPDQPLTTTDVVGADLNLVQRASVADVLPGESVEFTAWLTNASEAVLTDIVLSAALDPALIPLEIMATQGAARVVGQETYIHLGDLQPGQQAMISLRAKISASARNGHVILNKFAAHGEDILTTSNTVAVGLPPSQLPATGAEGRLP